MKNNTTKLTVLLLTSALALTALTVGTAEVSATETAEATETVETDSTEAVSADSTGDIRLAVLGGSTGYGAAKLINDNDAGTSSLHYAVTVETSPKVIQEGLIAEEYDIAALSTNKAALLASKTGSVQVAAVNTLGVMYLITADGTEISSLEDLKGTTVCIPEEPSYILEALLAAEDLTGEVTVETYATPSDLLTAVVSGEVTTAVLPEPLLTTAMAKKDTVAVQLSLTDEWATVYPDQELMQGCIVVRSSWAEEHPDELEAFLDEYEASIEYVQSNPDDAGTMIETWFGTPAAVAAKAIPRCNMTYIDGQEMKDALVPFYETLSTIESSNIGESVPDDSFYYIGE